MRAGLPRIAHLQAQKADFTAVTGDLVEVPGRGVARVVHDDVDLELLRHAGRNVLRGGRIREVRLYISGVRVPGGLAVDVDHAIAALDEHPADALADAVASPGDEDGELLHWMGSPAFDPVM